MFTLTRRDLMLWSAASVSQSLALNEPCAGVPRRVPWSVREEQAAAKQAAELIAEQTGEAVHPAAGEILHLGKHLSYLNPQAAERNPSNAALLLIFMWASWCPICKQLAPKLEAFWQAHRHEGVQLLGLSLDGDAKTTRQTLQKMKIQFPVAMSDSVKLGAMFAARSVPTLMVRSKRGVIVAVEEGDLERSELEALTVHL
jgi:thiol-disulfide isomerase/thioredoxin